MKKIYFKLIAVSMAMIIFQLQVKAGTFTNENSIATDQNEVEVYDAFGSIDGLISYLNENGDVSYDELMATNSFLVENVSSSAAIALNAAEEGGPPLLSPFLWGCLFSWVGLLVVYLTTDSNKAYTKGAWNGCLVNAGCNVLSGIVYAIAMSAGVIGSGYYY